MQRLYTAAIEYVRLNHTDEIDKAYEYFWEEDFPEDFLRGTALEMAFMNFEDWLLCDYRFPETFIDAYMEANPVGEDAEVLNAMKNSVISLYEVVSSDGGLRLKDLLLDEEAVIEDGAPELGAGEMFAARLLDIGGKKVMGLCVYPFGSRVKDIVLKYVDKQFKRYTDRKNPEGTMRQFLKDEAYLFNAIWINGLFKLR